MKASIRKIGALLSKELKNVAKNANILFMCLLPLLFAVIFINVFKPGDSEGMSKGMVLNLCLGMNLVMSSSFTVAMLIAEEKEKNTLRTLLLSGVTPMEFLTGKVLAALLISIVTNIALYFVIGMNAQFLPGYVLLTTLVTVCMIVIGAIVGIMSPNQMATGVTGLPVLMFLLMIPMFADFNEVLKKIAVFLPNYNLNLMLEKILSGSAAGAALSPGIYVILIWTVLSSALFAFVYNKVGLDK
jgi:ABC-2 type transport system permease protein